MRRKGGFLAAYLTCCGLLLPGLGCAIAADVFNPDLLPGVLAPSDGVILVALNNDTDFPAQFAFAVANNPTDAPPVETVPVNAGEVSNRVYDCPINLIQPIGVAILAGDAGIAIEYTAEPLFEEDIDCGDVIEIRIIQSGNGAAEGDFGLRVRVIPGR
jgi:hypothetical protein